MDISWLTDFEKRRGRPLRILHIGNIANNAYYNSKFLNDIGIHSDVFCYENYHIMSSPEWEEAELNTLPKNQYYPDWWNLGINDFERQRWFAQGPWNLCIDYLITRLNGDQSKADILWEMLEKARIKAHNYREIYKIARKIGSLVQEPYSTIGKEILNKFVNSRSPAKNQIEENPGKSKSYKLLIDAYSKNFPDRKSKLSTNDIDLYYARSNALKPLLAKYDIIQAYATNAIHVLLSGFKPYVAFEHGTLRDSPESDTAYKGPFYPNPSGKLTALAYKLADHVFVTNADVLSSIKKLKIKNYSPICHPFDETAYIIEEKYYDHIRAKIGSKYIFLCPIRHDWNVKGVDKYIRALPGLREKLGSTFKVCFIPWGEQIRDSKNLIKDQGCEDLVEWVGPFGRVWFRRWMYAADVIFDQLAYDAFGVTAPQAMACGVPVMIRYDEETISWMYGALPPALKADSEESVVRQTLQAIKPEFREKYKIEAKEWIRKYHSAEKTTNDLLNVYKTVITNNQNSEG